MNQEDTRDAACSITDAILFVVILYNFFMHAPLVILLSEMYNLQVGIAG